MIFNTGFKVDIAVAGSGMYAAGTGIKRYIVGKYNDGFAFNGVERMAAFGKFHIFAFAGAKHVAQIFLAYFANLFQKFFGKEQNFAFTFNPGIFNIVFFITIVSLVVQGTTISFVARILHLSEPLAKTGNDFGVELPEEIDSDLSDMTVTREMLEEADTLKDMNLPKGTLVMIVKRKDEFLIPNGTLKLHEGDKLLLISEKSKEESDSE